MFLKRNKILFVALFIVFGSCESFDSTSPVIKAIEIIKGKKIEDRFKAIVIINQNTCATCNKDFSQFISQYTNRKDMLYVVTVERNAFDISSYPENRDNILFDDEKVFLKQGLVKTSTVLLMDEGTIDTTLEMTVNTIAGNVSYLENKLNNWNITY